MYDNHLVHNEGTTKLKYGYAARFEVETKEEAVERIYNQIADVDCSVYDNGHRPLYMQDNKLFYKSNCGSEKEFKDAFQDKWEDAEVLAIVEARIVKELMEYDADEKARREAEEAAAQTARDEARKAKYLAWKNEADRLGIPFRDLCDMKRAEMEEDLYDDWD